MSYTVRGKGINKISFSQNDFITSGGEGKVYVKGNVVYKIYHDYHKMIPEAKIQELSVLTKDNIIKPEDIVLDDANHNIGFTMKFIPKTVAMCKLFVTPFRTTNHITPQDTQQLIDNIIAGTEFIHSKGCLIVDNNEMNYLVDSKNFTMPYFIDVNSYQTKSFPSTSIMLSIRDWKATKWTTLSDWYSFAIVACQLYIGIHPFKGSHPNYERLDLEHRMKDGVSIFNNKVRIPSTVRDFSNIPDEVMRWFIKLFEKGERIPPPQVAGLLNVMQVKEKIVTTTNNFIFDLIKEYDADIMKYLHYNMTDLVWTKNGRVFVGGADYQCENKAEVIFSYQTNTPIKTVVINNMLKLTYLKDGKEIPITANATDIINIDNTLYSRYEERLNEIAIVEMGDKLLASVKCSWNIMQNSSQVLENFIYQDILGRAYVTIPDPLNNACHNVAIKELDGYRVINGKYDKRVAIFTLFGSNKYSRAVVRFDKTFTNYDCRFIDNIDYSPVNFVVMDNGTVAFINEDHELQLFSNIVGVPDVKVVKDENINMDMILYKRDSKVAFTRRTKVRLISLKK